MADIFNAIEAKNLTLLTSLITSSSFSSSLNSPNPEGLAPLHVASFTGCCDLARALAGAGADVDVGDEDGRSPIYVAIENSHLDMVDLLIELRANFNTTDQYGLSPLYFTMMNTKYNMFRRLADAGACIDPKYEAKHANELRLWTAVLRGDLDELRRRIDAGDSVDQTPQGGTARGWTALWLAVALGREDAARMLIQAGADVHLVGFGSRLPLHIAVTQSNCGLIRALVEAGADVNTMTSLQKAPIHEATEKDNLELAELLVSLGANIDVLDSSDFTPLLIASKNGSTTMTRLLLDNSADTEVKHSTGRTAAHLAACNGHHEVLTLLAGAGANINAKDKQGRTPAHAAAENGHAEVIKVLAEAGADFNATSEAGKTPLHLAVENCHMKAARLLVEAGADVHVMDEYGYSVLRTLLLVCNLCCSPKEIREMFTLLTTAGATVDGATATISPLVPSDVIRAIVPENTPFWLAANNDAPMLAAELAGGLDLNMKTENGMTLLHWACAGDAPECVDILLTAGASVDVGIYPDETIYPASQCGADHSEEDATPVFHCMHESSECLSAMINAGANVNPFSREGFPINYALAANSPACVTALVGAGAWVTGEDMADESYSGFVLETALTASQVSQDGLRALLAAAGERVVSEEIHGMPPLHWAVRSCTVDVVRTLIEAGANPEEEYELSYGPSEPKGNALQLVQFLLAKSWDSATTARFAATHDYLETLECYKKEQ